MKRLLLLPVLIFLSHLGIAQCIAHAGGNQHACLGMETTTAVIGGNPTASGGTAPYTYCWSTNPIPVWPNSSIFYTASDFLNDTTAANPVLNASGLVNSPTTFYLKVTDALGCVSYDSCKVTFTRYTYGLGLVVIYIDQNAISNGDSVTVNLMTVSGSSYTPLSYIWQPAYGLSTTTLATGFKALPSVSTTYSVMVTDSKGCSSLRYAVYYINVCPPGQVAQAGGMFCAPVSIRENGTGEAGFSVYPDPASNSVTVELMRDKVYTLKLSTMLGSVCKEISLAEERTEIDLSQLQSGIYFLQMLENGEPVAVKKIIKE